MDKAHKIGEPIVGPRPAVFELVIEDHVKRVDLAAHGITDLSSIDPCDYFITSGDAVRKAEVLEKDLRALLTQIHIKAQLDETLAACAAEVATVLAQCERLLVELRAARGPDLFLESEWGGDHQLYVVPKNPRLK